MVTITKGPKCSVAQMLNGIYYCNLVSAIRFVSFCTWPFLHCSIWVRYILISWHYVLNKNKSMTSICIKNKYLPQIMSTNSLILLHRILINGSKSQAYLIRETVFSSKQAICHFIQFFFQWIFKKLKYKKSLFFLLRLRSTHHILCDSRWNTFSLKEMQFMKQIFEDSIVNT